MRFVPIVMCLEQRIALTLVAQPPQTFAQANTAFVIHLTPLTADPLTLTQSNVDNARPIPNFVKLNLNMNELTGTPDTVESVGPYATETYSFDITVTDTLTGETQIIEPYIYVQNPPGTPEVQRPQIPLNPPSVIVTPVDWYSKLVKHHHHKRF